MIGQSLEYRAEAAGYNETNNGEHDAREFSYGIG